jgi:hypothetical protein
MKKSFALSSVLVDSPKVAAAESALRNINTQFIRSLRTHALFMAVVVSYVAACLIVAWLYEASDKISLSLVYNNNLRVITEFYLLLFLIGRFSYTMIFIRPEHLTRHILDDLKTNYLNAERILTALPVLLLIPVFISVFTSYKAIIPLIKPYSWDPVFVEWEAALHGGVQPWQLLQPILGRPLITSTINFFYNLWFFVMYAVLFWQAFSLRNPRLRMQFYLTFISTWILLGNVCATLFSSVGPCYYGRVFEGGNIFQPLMEYLWAANEMFPVWSLGIQEMLWEAYEVGGNSIAQGISAMPSMHVSVAFLFAILGWRTGRALGVALTVFASLIMIGSVHLGWHYAIDGYAAIAGTWFIWWAIGRLLNRNDCNNECENIDQEIDAP